MRALNAQYVGRKLTRLRSGRRFQNWITLGLVGLGPILVVTTFLVLGPLDQDVSPEALRAIILADFVYVLIVVALAAQQVARMVAARRAKSAGSRLHLRLTGLFALVALIPTVLVAVFATITVNFGLEGWFSDRVQRVVGASLAAAQAYEREQRNQLELDAQLLATFLNGARQSQFQVSDGELRQLMTTGQSQIQRGLREAFIVDGTGELRVRGERSYLFDFERPDPAQMEAAREGAIVIIDDWENSEFRALLRLNAFTDRYLYISREVDGDLLTLLDDTEETIQLYQQLEQDRGRLLFEFGLLYIGFALMLIVAAIWLGMWFAERLARPVGRLAGAAQRVGAGDLDVKVPEQTGDDEIAMLGRLFNQMTRQLKAQRDALLANTRQIEERRRLFDSVLSSITAGVIGLDAEGRVDFVNRAAVDLLSLREDQRHGAHLRDLVPEFEDLFDELRGSSRNGAQREIRLTRHRHVESLLVRMARRQTERGELEGYVVAFDDVTELATAQRMAAWGDVARRIAHEIKNPLTPIQLSAERVNRKFGKLLGDDAPALAELTGVIVRQTNDLRRIVDEFSKFARMPEPERQQIDLAATLRDAVILQQGGQPEVTIDLELPEGKVWAELDPTLISQALTNLIKNAGEAIETRKEKQPEREDPGEIRVVMDRSDGQIEIRIADNGIGLPPDRAKLFEPYVTTREKGTGLGLPIVRKIIEEHSGTLQLRDAEPFTDGAPAGAEAVISLPLAGSKSNPETSDREKKTA